MRLIDADALDFASCSNVDECGAEVFNAPTIDAVPVVRCKDCKFQGTIKCPTYHITYFSEKESWELDGEDDFCSYGERKDGE